MRNTAEYTIWNSVTPQAITSSTDATPIVITKASHGLSTGDLVIIYGHTTNVAANGIRKVTVLTSSTFSLQNPYTGADIAGSGAGAGSNTGIFVAAPKIAMVEDFQHAIFTMHTAGTATLTVKVAGSLGKLGADVAVGGTDSPNFGGTLGDTNPYQFVECINLDTGADVDGATGVVLSGADTNTQYEVNVNGLKYLTFIPTAWTQGSITIKLKLFNNQ